MPTKKGPHAIDRHVGSRVRMRRMQLNMSQEKLGDAFGLTFQQVQKYEKGINRMGSSRLHQASQILQVPVAWFFEESPQEDRKSDGQAQAMPAALVTDFVATPEGLALSKAFSQIKDRKVRRCVVHLVKAIAGD